MSQLFSWRFLAALGALVGLALLTNAVLADDGIDEVLDEVVVQRDIDLIAPVFAVEKSDDYRVRRNGITVGYADFIIEEGRVVRVVPGTPGELNCDALDEINGCAIFVDLLGEAVVWYSVLPQGPRFTAEVPEVVDLDAGDAVLINGWRISFPPVIERECGDEDIPSFSDFLRHYGPGSTSTVDLTTQEVVSVRCGPRRDRTTTVPSATDTVNSGE